MVKKEIKRRLKYLIHRVKYYSFLPGPAKTKPVIIMMLDNKMKHGGLLDRIKGIMSAKIIAEELGYDFKIYTNHKSFPLFNYLIPVNANMVAKEKEIIYNVWFSKPILLYNRFAITREQITHLFKSRHSQYHVYCNLDLCKKLYASLNNNELNAVWRKHFFSLFNFSASLESQYSQLFQGSKNIAGIHLRFTSSLGDFKELVNQPLPEQEKQALLKKCINHVMQLSATNVFTQYIVVSDSILFTSELEKKKNNKVVITGGITGHIDINYAEEILEKALLDFYLLSKCNTVYLIVSHHMHNSQFSKYAAILGNAPYVIERI